MSKYTLGIDFGTLSGRCVVVSTADGSILADVSMNYPHGVMSDKLPFGDVDLPADYALQYPADYTEVLTYVVKEAVKLSGVSPADIIGLGIDFTTCTVFPTDEKGTPMCEYEEYKCDPHSYVKLWKHHAAQPYADRLTALLNESDDDRLDSFGGKVSSEWLIPKILQIYEEAPEIYNACSYMCEAGDWLTYLLTGERCHGYMFAAYKGLYDSEKGFISSELLEKLSPGFGNALSDKLYPVKEQFTRAGTLNKKWADILGLCEGTSVSVPFPDAHVAAPALAVDSPGIVSAIFGTSACFMNVDEKYYNVPGICGVVKNGVLPGYYGYESGLCCYGDLFAWFCDNCVPAEYKEEAETRGIPVIQLITEKAAELKAGESGIIALDWWNGNRNVLVDGNLSGMMVGLTINTKPHEIYRALLEATAFAVKKIFDTMAEHGVCVHTLHAGGGIAKKNPFAMQMLSDVLRMKIRVSGASQIPALASAIYAAVFAGEENGGYAGITEAQRAMSAPFIAEYTPNEENSEVYAKLYSEYCTLHDYFGRGANDVMKRLRAISENAKK